MVFFPPLPSPPPFCTYYVFSSIYLYIAKQNYSTIDFKAHNFNIVGYDESIVFYPSPSPPPPTSCNIGEL